MTTCPTWEELKAIVRDGRDEIKDFLKSLPSKHRMAGALALSVAHWHPSERGWILETNKYGTKSCGLCVHFKEEICAGCPLDKWWNNQPDDDFNRAADKLYNALADLYRKEWEKL